MEYTGHQELEKLHQSVFIHRTCHIDGDSNTYVNAHKNRRSDLFSRVPQTPVVFVERYEWSTLV